LTTRKHWAKQALALTSSVQKGANLLRSLIGAMQPK
jgi:hypothetical protein